MSPEVCGRRESEMRRLAEQADLPALRAKYLKAAESWARLALLGAGVAQGDWNLAPLQLRNHAVLP